MLKGFAVSTSIVIVIRMTCNQLQTKKISIGNNWTKYCFLLVERSERAYILDNSILEWIPYVFRPRCPWIPHITLLVHILFLLKLLFMKTLVHNVMHIQLQVTGNRKRFIYQAFFSNFAKQRLQNLLMTMAYD